MNSPFWQLFEQLQRQLSTAPAIDQYFYFLKTLQDKRISNSISHLADLRRFCKLFWLLDIKEEEIFDRLFDGYASFITTFFRIQDQLPTTPIEQGSSSFPIESTTQDEQENKDDDELSPHPDSSQDQSAVNIPSTQPGYSSYLRRSNSGYELHISDSRGGSSRQHTSIDHHYQLNDQAIMPFDLRRFALLLRSHIQTYRFSYTHFPDTRTMIQQYCRQGYLSEVMYRRQNTSDSHVVFLADRHGSMLAYEFWEEQLEMAFKAVPMCRFEHYHYYNIPKRDKTGEHFLMHTARGNQPFHSKDNQWTSDTHFFIFSDAGAQSGIVNKARIRLSLHWWFYLNKISPYVYWLNPIPEEYHKDDTATRLRFNIPMVYPDQAGLYQMMH